MAIFARSLAKLGTTLRVELPRTPRACLPAGRLLGILAMTALMPFFYTFKDKTHEEPVARTYYRKLIRDRIPEIVSARGLRCRTRRLSPAAYTRALKEKVLEESSELLGARGRAAVLN